MAASTIRVVITPHWVNACLLLWAARPLVLLDGVEHAVHWSEPREFPVESGRHSVKTYMRYKGFDANLGAGQIDVDLEIGESADIVARNGWVNSAPFIPRRVSAR